MNAGGYPEGYAYGRCPLSCGAVGGDLAGMADVKPPPPGAEHVRDLTHGFVRLWPHLSARRPALGPCLGSRQLTIPLPLMGPSGVDRAEAMAAFAEATRELTLF